MKVGYIQKLHVNRFTPNGAYLVDEQQEEVLLPNRYITDKTHEGEEINVFVYYDSEDRLVASTDVPFAIAGEVAYMEVIDKNSTGVFLDWGLPKDLLLPNSNQQFRVEVGDWCVVMVYVDDVSGGIVATTKLNKHISNMELELSVGAKVEIVVYEAHSLGFRVIVNNTHWGMIYENQIFQEIQIGDILKAFVTKVTEDNRLDLSLQAVGVKQIKNASQVILELLEQGGGELSLGDKSTPEEIYEVTKLSKKMFKRGIGGLLRQEEIIIEPTKIKRKS